MSRCNAYKFDGGDWIRFKSQWPQEKRFAREIAEEALEDYSVRHVDYDHNDVKIEVAIRCHSFAFYGSVEARPVFICVEMSREEAMKK
jgi:hypothetical protein